MKKLLTTITTKLISLTTYINKTLENFRYYINRSPEIASTNQLLVLDVTYNKRLFAYSIRLQHNPNLKGSDIFEAVWNTLTSLPEWRDSENKILIIAIQNSITGAKFFINKKMLIHRETNFIEYF